MIPESTAIDGPAYRALLIERGLLVPAEKRRTKTWWHPEPPTCLLLGIPEEKVEPVRFYAS